ncbi:MAG TPA: hypothetical protein VFQ41_10745 [Candidatus Angelobacter sp.]|nr:hypothetical protein [Candidatus Angelobacter sp.]
MKLTIAMCLLTSMAIGQEAAGPAHGRVPSLVVNIVGQQASSYDVKVVNRSRHAVTAFALRLGSTDDRQNCDGSCSRVEMVADNARPAIKAGESVDLGVDASKVNGGAVAAEAAVFDDESYEGDERAAALLVAQQIGRQAEYDRLIVALNVIMATSGNDVRKIAQMRIKLSELPVRLDPAMVQTFKQWFPELAACTKRYARFMKAAAKNEKRLVAESIDQFAHGAGPGASLIQWWSAMQQRLAPFGCNGCAALAMKPKAPASSRNVAQPCREDVAPILLTASLADYGSLVEVEEELAMDADLSEEDEAALDADEVVPDTRMPSRTPARAVEAEPSEKTDVPANTPAPPSNPVAAALPSGIPLIPAPDGKGYLLGRTDFSDRPAPDYVMYRAFFRDIASFGDMALYEEVRWDLSGRRLENNGPRAGGLSKAEISTLQQVAADTNRQVGVVFTKKETLLRAKILIYPGWWLLYAPPIPGLRELDVQETQTLDTGIQRLRSILGTASFARLDGFVRGVYHAKPGKLVLIHLTDDAIYSRFFQYLAVLDELSGNIAAQQEESKRQNELRLAGLAQKDWILLLKVAKDHQQLSDRLYKPVPRSIQPTEDAEDGQAIEALAQSAPAPSPTTRAYPAGVVPAAQTTSIGVSAAMPSLGEALHSNPVMLNEPQAGLQGMPVPLGTLTLTPEAYRKERELKQDKLALELMTDVAQLKAGFGEPRFQKFETYLRHLYANAGIETAAPLEEKVKKVEAQQAKNGKTAETHAIETQPTANQRQ